MTPRPYRVMLTRFPHGARDEPDVTDFYCRTCLEIKDDPRLSKDITTDRKDDTPITIGRNAVLKTARESGIDFLLMVDNDMKPDAYRADNPHALGMDPSAKPFWRSSLDFLIHMRESGTPAVIAAPYCGPPPFENVYVFKWESFAGDMPPDTIDSTLEQYSRSEAASKSGIEQVAALPTGLILIDMEAVRKVPPPYCYYEYDPEQTRKQSTEDVVFTRDLTFHGVPIFCNWDAWCGHWKRKCVGKPRLINPEEIQKKMRDAILRPYNIGQNEKLVEVGRRGNGPWQSDHKEDLREVPTTSENGTPSETLSPKRPLLTDPAAS